MMKTFLNRFVYPLLIIGAIVIAEILKPTFLGSESKKSSINESSMYESPTKDNYFIETFGKDGDPDSTYPYNDSYYEEPTPEPLYFGEYECTDDCSGHEAGYEWASDKGITDPDDCGGNSQSFIEGCMEYASEYSDY